ncbi:MAG: NAD(P)-binding protein [Sphaerochaetaceae bacterium]
MDERYDVIVIGSGIGSLTSAALLAKSGLSVAVFERNSTPGGSCGAFRLNGRTVDQGTSMLFGFGKTGFNPHRFVFNVLEEPIEVIRHTYMYRLIYDGFPILFHRELKDYFDTLENLFPDDIEQIKAFYAYINDLYTNVIAVDSSYMSPSEMNRTESLGTLFAHPIRLAKTLSLLHKSAGEIIRKYISSEEVIKYFNKLTSTYCYTTIDETPAILAITMFMENHVGGAYYPLGSSMQLPGKLEKAIQKFNGELFFDSEVESLIFTSDDVKKAGVAGVTVRTQKGERTVYGTHIIYGGVLKPLYTSMVEEKYLDREKVERVLSYEMTFPSIVLYCIVDKEGIPEGTLPIEMFGDNPEVLDEKEITLYAYSLSEPSICREDEHVVIALGPSLREWPHPDTKGDDPSSYDRQKEQEAKRMILSIEKHYPGFSSHVREYRVATPTTIEEFTGKEKGAVAGIKNMIGQDLLNRQHAQGDWDNLYIVGESTVMGTGSPAVTISGISAANLILRKMGRKEFRYEKGLKDVVTVHEGRGPAPRKDGKRVIPSLNAITDEKEAALHDMASMCQWCLDAPCTRVCPGSYQIPRIMRRLEAGNMEGAAKDVAGTLVCASCDAMCEDVCSAQKLFGKSVSIKDILTRVYDRED